MRNRPLLLAGILLTVGVLLSQAPRLFTSTQAAAPVQAVTLPSPGAPGFLTPREVQQIMKAGTPVQIGDVRKANAYARRHIQGALSLPHKELSTWGPKLSKDRLVILYCA